jgi:hypothetical protein
MRNLSNQVLQNTEFRLECVDQCRQTNQKNEQNGPNEIVDKTILTEEMIKSLSAFKMDKKILGFDSQPGGLGFL